VNVGGTNAARRSGIGAGTNGTGLCSPRERHTHSA
jgi:hypothetical protein